MRVARWEQRNSGVVREGLVDSAHTEDTRRGMKGCLRVHARVSSADMMRPHVGYVYSVSFITRTLLY